MGNQITHMRNVSHRRIDSSTTDTGNGTQSDTNAIGTSKNASKKGHNSRSSQFFPIESLAKVDLLFVQINLPTWFRIVNCYFNLKHVTEEITEPITKRMWQASKLLIK